MFTSSVTNSARAQHHSADNDSGAVAQGSSAAEKSKEKAAASSSKKPEFADNNRYNASPIASSSGQARVAKLTRSNATRENDFLQTPPHSTQERGESSLQRVNAGHTPAMLQRSEEMMASHKANRANPIPEKPSSVPQRLKEKIKSLDLPKLKKLDKDLHKYAQMVVSRAKAGKSPDSKITEKDLKMLPLLAQAENSRNPGLNLHVFKTASECHEAIRAADKEVQQSGVKSSMRIVYPPLKNNPVHHVALDVSLMPKHDPSIVFFESVRGPSVMDSLANEFTEDNMHFVGTFAQNSDWDCVMFAMSNALKAHKHQDDYTSHLHKEEILPTPAYFLKHAHSKQRVERFPRKDELVTKDKAGPHKETLEHRNLAYRTQRGKHAFSTSIEGFRMQEIKRAGEYLEAQGAGSAQESAKERHNRGLFSFLRGNK